MSNVVVNSKETTATIEVKAKDGTTKRYTLVITKVAVNTDLMNVTVNGTTVSNANGTYTYLKTGISSDKTADVSITTQDANSTVKVEAITRDLTKSPYGLSYNEVGSESQNVWANDAVTLHSQPVNRYRITVTGQDEFTTKEYTLIIRDTDTNADVEYIKVGTYYAVKDSSDVNGETWTVEIPDTTKFTNVTVQASDELAELTDIEKLRQNAYDNNPSNVGYVTQIVSGLDLQTGDEIRYFKVVSQDGSLQKMYKLVIKGTDEAPSVESVTVNGLDATAPTDSEPRYTYLEVLPNASEVLIGVTAASKNHFVSINNGDITAGGYAELKVSMPISVTEMEVPFRLYRTADGDPAYENVVYLKRLSDDYALTVKVDNNTVKKTNLDGSYVYYVDGTATSADVWALASNANYRVEITGKDGVSGNNNTNPTLGATVTTDLEDTINSNFTEVTITVKSDDITNTATAEYKLYIYKKSNNANIKSVIVSEGVTAIGERLFQYCDNLKTVSLPTTLTAIKKAAFLPHIDGYIYHQSLNGLTELKIPERVTELGVNAFAGTAIKSVTVPFSVTTVGAMTFSECQYLEMVRYGGKVISDRMFVRCTKLKNLTLTRNVKEIVGGCFNYCESLNQITYEGSLADWNAVKKNTNWDSHAVDIESPLAKIQCLDGYMEYVENTKTWKEVKS